MRGSIAEEEGGWVDQYMCMRLTHLAKEYIKVAESIPMKKMNSRIAIRWQENTTDSYKRTLKPGLAVIDEAVAAFERLHAPLGLIPSTVIIVGDPWDIVRKNDGRSCMIFPAGMFVEERENWNVIVCTKKDERKASLIGAQFSDGLCEPIEKYEFSSALIQSLLLSLWNQRERVRQKFEEIDSSNLADTNFLKLASFIMHPGILVETDRSVAKNAVKFYKL